MPASILDGKALAKTRRQKLNHQIERMISKGYPAPQLAVILLGKDPASVIYVENKRTACKEASIHSIDYNLPATTSEKELIELIAQLNQDESVNGILVQMPLPEHINTTKIIEFIDPLKDVDGFHPYNIGRLTQRIPVLRPCTPYGIINLLDHNHIPIKGKHALVVGASNHVGRPMFLEFLLAGATVTICHKFSTDIEKHARTADILVSATGKKHLINTEWLHDKQVVIDVGIHRLDNGKVCGDIDFAKASEKVAWITPVPGGVGPMTIVTLLENTWFAYQKIHQPFQGHDMDSPPFKRL